MDWFGFKLYFLMWMLYPLILDAQSTPSVKGPTCVSGEFIEKPDKCNNCICFEGEIHCTNIPCNQPTDQPCNDDDPALHIDECNICYCFDGRWECTNLVCIKGSKCVNGEKIPKPDSCNKCKCYEGHIMCTKNRCDESSLRDGFKPDNSTELQPQETCVEGEHLPSPPPPNDCNKCLCVNQRVVCTKATCRFNVSIIE